MSSVEQIFGNEKYFGGENISRNKLAASKQPLGSSRHRPRMRENETGGTASLRGVDPAIQSLGTWAVDLHVSEPSGGKGRAD